MFSGGEKSAGNTFAISEKKRNASKETNHIRTLFEHKRDITRQKEMCYPHYPHTYPHNYAALAELGNILETQQWIREKRNVSRETFLF